MKSNYSCTVTSSIQTIFRGDGDIYRDDADMLIVSPLSDEVSGQRVIPETGGGWSWSALRSINFYWIIWETVKTRKCATNMKPGTLLPCLFLF